MQIISRKTAKNLGLIRYFTGSLCFRGHLAERQVSDKACVDCKKLRHLALMATEEGKARARASTARYRTTEKGKANVAAYSISEHRKAAQRLVYATEEWKVQRRVYNRTDHAREIDKRHRKTEKAKITRAKYEATELRREQKKRANERPGYIAWLKSPEGVASLNASKAQRRAFVKEGRVALTRAELNAIKEFYIEADWMSKSTGIPHEVDHILPLTRGGKHHPGNLQVTTAARNHAKQNLTEEEFELSQQRGFRMRLDI